jgi:hypothetical protein
LPGPQVAIVQYSPHHVLNDWVYNAADIDNSKVIWARQMDPASDRELLEYYKDRKAWLVQPDCTPPKISPFSATRGGPVRHDDLSAGAHGRLDSQEAARE